MKDYVARRELDVPHIHFSGELFQRAVLKSAKSAVGADGWSPAEVALLPLSWFEGLAIIWEAV